MNNSNIDQYLFTVYFMAPFQLFANCYYAISQTVSETYSVLSVFLHMAVFKTFHIFAVDSTFPFSLLLLVLKLLLTPKHLLDKWSNYHWNLAHNFFCPISNSICSLLKFMELGFAFFVFWKHGLFDFMLINTKTNNKKSELFSMCS